MGLSLSILLVLIFFKKVFEVFVFLVLGEFVIKIEIGFVLGGNWFLFVNLWVICVLCFLV